MVKSYNIIAKVSNDKFIKFRKVDNLRRAQAYLIKTYPDFRYCNYYNSKTKVQEGSFTRKTIL